MPITNLAWLSDSPHNKFRELCFEESYHLNCSKYSGANLSVSLATFKFCVLIKEKKTGLKKFIFFCKIHIIKLPSGCLVYSTSLTCTCQCTIGFQPLPLNSIIPISWCEVIKFLGTVRRKLTSFDPLKYRERRPGLLWATCTGNFEILLEM